jgi:hypothetical protein
MAARSAGLRTRQHLLEGGLAHSGTALDPSSPSLFVKLAIGASCGAFVRTAAASRIHLPALAPYARLTSEVRPTLWVFHARRVQTPRAHQLLASGYPPRAVSGARCEVLQLARPRARRRRSRPTGRRIPAVCQGMQRAYSPEPPPTPDATPHHLSEPLDPRVKPRCAAQPMSPRRCARLVQPPAPPAQHR